jgi:hypothetical protein
VGREVCAVQAGDLTDHLLGRESTRANYNEVAGDWLWLYVLQRFQDIAVSQIERLSGDCDVTSGCVLCHGFSVLVSLLRTFSVPDARVCVEGQWGAARTHRRGTALLDGGRRRVFLRR